MNDDRAWTPSHREEVISALWFIVAGVAHLGLATARNENATSAAAAAQNSPDTQNGQS